MTEKENFMKLLRGEQPEWIPNYRDVIEWVFPGFVGRHMKTEEKVDLFQVKWIEGNEGAMVDPKAPYALDDITRWKEVVQLPDLDQIDWAKMAEEDLAGKEEGKLVECICQLSTGGAFFIPLMNLMGFEEGLYAMMDEEEAVHEFFDYLCENLEKMIDYMVQYYKPDIMLIGDDICSASSPMISMDLYNELLKPYYERLINRIKTYNLPIEFHMCGKGECFVHDFVSMGVNMWQPAQPMNDLQGLKEQYGNRLILCGGWYSAGKGGVEGAPEADVRASVRESMDAYGKGGGYVFWDGDPVGNSEDMMRKMAWLADEAHIYGKNFY